MKASEKAGAIFTVYFPVRQSALPFVAEFAGDGRVEVPGVNRETAHRGKLVFRLLLDSAMNGTQPVAWFESNPLRNGWV